MELKLANSTKNDITVVINQIMKEAIRDGLIDFNPILNVECLNKTAVKPRDSLSISEVKKLFPANYAEALKIWESHYNYTMMTLLITSGMRSGELRALKWGDIIWEDSGILITKVWKDRGEIGTVKENREKFVRVPHKTITLLQGWKDHSKAKEVDDFVFYGRYTNTPINRTTIRDIFKRGLKAAEIIDDKNLVPHSLRHTYRSLMLGGLPGELVRRFTGHSTEHMSKHYYHPVLKQELKQTEQYQDQIDKIWE
jgi:integrase